MKKLLILFFTCFTCTFSFADMTWGDPEILSTDVPASTPRIVIDSSGNVTAAWVQNGVITATNHPVSGAWESPTTLSGTSSSSPRLGVDGSGNVTAIWVEGGVIKSKVFNGTSWSSVATVSDTGASGPALAVDSTGNAVAVWVRSGFVETATKLSGGAWSAASVLSAAASDFPDVAISSNGTVVAVWHTDASGIHRIQSSSATSVGGAWGTAKIAISGAAGLNHNRPKVALDSSGNALAVWFRYNPVGSDFRNVTIVSATLAPGATNWGLPVAISTPGMRDPATLSLRVAFDANGNAMAFWGSSSENSTFNIESAVKPAASSTWTDSNPLVAIDKYAQGGDLAVSSSGVALAVYMAFDGDCAFIQSQDSFLPSAFPNFWTGTVIASDPETQNGFPRCATSLSGNTQRAAVIWTKDNSSDDVVVASIGSRTLIAPPTSLGVSQSSHDCGVFVEYFNTLTWSASSAPNIAQYIVYRNGIVFDVVTSSTFSIVDHNATQNGAVTYGVAAKDNEGSESLIATVSFP